MFAMLLPQSLTDALNAFAGGVASLPWMANYAYNMVLSDYLSWLGPGA